MADLDRLIAEAELGEKAREFLEGDLGQALLKEAEKQIESAHLSLETMDPRNKHGIQKIQNEIQVARWFQQWLIEFIDRGAQALEVYKHESKD